MAEEKNRHSLTVWETTKDEAGLVAVGCVLGCAVGVGGGYIVSQAAGTPLTPSLLVGGGIGTVVGGGTAMYGAHRIKEARAQAAERSSLEIKCMRFMEGKLGECFSGMVTGVHKRGYSIELDDFPIEGFAAKPETPRRRKSPGGLYLGDRVMTRLLRADPYTRDLELGLVKNSALDSDNY